MKQIERTRRWQKSRHDAGLCIQCGNPLGAYAWVCDSCTAKRQAIKGATPWKHGGIGRPTLSSQRKLLTHDAD